MTSRSHPRDPLDPSYAPPRRLAIQYPLPLSSLHHQHLLFLTLPTHKTERGVRPLHLTLLPTASSGSDLPDKTTLRNERPHIPLVMSSTSANQDPALAPPPTATAPPAGAPATDPAASPHLLDSAQIVQLLRHFPSVYQVSHPPCFYILFLPPPTLPAGARPTLSVRVVPSEHLHMCVGSCARLHVIWGGRSRLGHVRASVRCALNGPFFSPLRLFCLKLCCRASSAVVAVAPHASFSFVSTQWAYIYPYLLFVERRGNFFGVGQHASSKARSTPTPLHASIL